MPSVLDRLVDPTSSGTDARRGYGLQQVFEVIRRDLEDLLNTRQSNADIPPELTRVRESIALYGIPDLTSFTVTSATQREAMAVELEKIIAKHEPRLRDIRVHLVDLAEGSRPTIRCRIEGRLALDPAPEVSFDTIMEPLTGQHVVRQGET
jgi:type VI secretion system protein ImpF